MSFYMYFAGIIIGFTIGYFVSEAVRFYRGRR